MIQRYTLIPSFTGKESQSSVSLYIVFQNKLSLNSEWNSKNALLNPISYRMINSKEKEYLGINENLQLSISSKLRFNRKIFHSVSLLSNGKKKSSHFIKYFKDNNVCFGSIIYFFSFNQSIFVGVLKHKQVKENIFSDLTGNLNTDIQVLRKNGSLNDFFYCVEASNDLDFISPEFILNICFVFNLDSNYIILSDLITETEHD